MVLTSEKDIFLINLKAKYFIVNYLNCQKPVKADIQ